MEKYVWRWGSVVIQEAVDLYNNALSDKSKSNTPFANLNDEVLDMS